MSLKELTSRFTSITETGYGHWRVVIRYRKKLYTCITTNSMAIDATHMEEWERRWNGCGYSTCKQAYQALYNECKRVNNL